MRLLLILISSALLSASASSITLNEALESAYDNNIVLKADREALKAKDEHIMEALSRMLPTLSLAKSKINGKRVPTGEQNDGIRTRKINGFTEQLVLTQNLFRGGADIATLVSVRNSIEAARAELHHKEQVTLRNVVESFLKLNAADSKYKNAVKMEKETKEYVYAIEQRFKVGEVTKTDVARAQAAYATSRARKSNNWAEFLSEKTKFENITLLEGNNLVLSDPEKGMKLPASMEEAIAISLKKNPQIVNAEYLRKASAEQVKASIGGLMPRVELKHQIENLDHSPVVSSERNFKANYTTVVEVSVPVFDGGASWSKVRSAKRANKQSQYNVMNTNNEVTQSATNAWVALNARRDILKSRKDALEASKIAYEGALEEEKAGIRASVDVVNAHQEYFQSYEQYVDAKTEYYLSLYNLKMVLGECTAQGLNLKVKAYDPLENYNKIKWQLIGAY